MLTLAQIQNLFPTPLLTFTVDDAESLNRDLMAEIAARRAAVEGKRISNRRGWHSAYDLFQRKEKAQARLAAIIRAAVEQATRRLAPRIDLAKVSMECDGWINVNPTGAYNAPHDHGGSLWSGTYYVVNPEVEDRASSSGEIEFIRPRGGLADTVIKAPFTASKCVIRPRPGTLLLFPSNILHWVHPNEAEEDRVTVAFNARFWPREAVGKGRK